MKVYRAFQQHIAAAIVLSVATLWSLAVFAGEAFVLRLGTEGSSIVVLSTETATAFVTDGGRKSGLVGANIGGQSVADVLNSAKIKHLIVTCSHPHDDHLSGLVEFLKSDRITALDLQRVDFVESGYGDDSLHKQYEAYWEKKEKRPPVSVPHTANGKNAFGDIDFQRGMTVDVQNLAYKAKDKAGAHGRSVVTIYELRSGGDTTRLVDFDDADTYVIEQYIEWVRANDGAHLTARRPDVAIMPHHGTSLDATDVRELFKKDVRPRDVIFTVNDENRYLHPHPKTVALCLRELGAEHVYFTAGSNNVTITGTGVRQPKEAPLARYANAIQPKLARIETRVSQLRERSVISELTVQEQSYIERYGAWSSGMLDIFDWYNGPQGVELTLRDLAPTRTTASSLPANLGNYPLLVTRSKIVDREGTEPGSTLDGGGGGGAPRGTVPSSVTQTDTQQNSRGGGGAFRGGGGSALGGGGGGFRGGSSRFRRTFNLAPIFGGVVLGNQYDSGGMRVQSAKIQIQRDEDGIDSPTLVVVAKDSKGQVQTLEYENVTLTELWCAMRFVDPTDVNKEFGLNLDVDDYGLVGIDHREDSNGAWFFGIHPAISNTMVAQDAMRLDMVLSGESRPKELNEYRISNYQWYDAPAVIRTEGKRITIVPEEDPFGVLLRVRLWGQASYVNPIGEILGRVQVSAKKAGLDKEPAYVVKELWPVEREVVVKTIDQTLWQDREKLLDAIREQRKAFYERLNVNDSPSVYLEEALEAATKEALESARKNAANALNPKENFSAMIERELLKIAKTNGPKDFEKSAAFRWWQIAAPYQYDPIFGDRSKMGVTIRELAIKAGLQDSPEFRIWELRQIATEEVFGSRNLEVDSGKIIQDLRREFAPLQRLDRFARVVALLRWVKDDTKALPSWPDVQIRPIRLNVPPVFFFGDVWEKGLPAVKK